MKFKRIMLAALLLLAVLTITAVSASDDLDANETLTADSNDEVSLDASVDENLVSEADEFSASDDDGVSDSQKDVASTRTSLTVYAKDIKVGETAVIECICEGNTSGRAKIGVTPIDNWEYYESYEIDFANSSRVTIEIPDLDVGAYYMEAIYSLASDITCRNYFMVINPNLNNESEFELWATEIPTVTIYNESDWIYIQLNDSNHVPEVKHTNANITGRWFRFDGYEITDPSLCEVNYYSGSLNWYESPVGRFSGDVNITVWYDYPIGMYRNTGNIVMGRVTNSSFFSFKSPVEFIFPEGPLALENDTRVVSVKAPADTNGSFIFSFEDLSYGGTLQDLRYSAEEDLYYVLIGDFVDLTDYDYNFFKSQKLANYNTTYMLCVGSYDNGNYFPKKSEGLITFSKLNLTIHAENVRDTIVLYSVDENGRYISEVPQYVNYAFTQIFDYKINGGKTQLVVTGDNCMAVIRNLQPGNVTLEVHSNAGGSYGSPSSLFYPAYATFNFTIGDNPYVDIEADNVIEGDATTIELSARSEINANATLIIDGISHPVELKDGECIFEIELDAGYHNSTFIFDGDDKYYGDSAFAEFTVYSNNRIYPNMTAYVDGDGMLIEGAPVSIIVTGEGNLTDTLYYTLSCQVYENGHWVSYYDKGKVEMTDGCAVLNRTYPYGTYSLNVEFEGSPFYLSDSADIDFDVYRLPVSTHFDIMATSGNIYQIMLKDIFAMRVPNATVSYTVNNVTRTLKLGEGRTPLNLSYLTEPCDVVLKYEGNEIYNSTSEIIEYKLDSAIEMMVNGKIYENTPFTVIITADENINGTAYLWAQNSYSINLINGYGEVTVGGLSAGNYDISVNYWGDNNYGWSSAMLRIYVIDPNYEGPANIDVGIWEVDDEKGTLYVDCEYPVLFVSVNDACEGNITVIVDDMQFDWTIEYDEYGISYHEWTLDDLEIYSPGNHSVEVRYGDDVIGNGTLTVFPLGIDEFRAFIDPEAEEIQVYCPYGEEGVIGIISEREEDDETVEVHQEMHRITSDDYGTWLSWSIYDLGYDGEDWMTFTIMVVNGGAQSFYTVLDYNAGDDGGDEIWLSVIEGDELIDITESGVIAYVIIPADEEFEGTVVAVNVTRNGEPFANLKTSDITPEFDEEIYAYVYPLALDLTKLSNGDILEIFMDEDSWTLAVEVNGDCLSVHEFEQILEMYAFYGNLTTGDLNDPEAMGPHPNGNLISFAASDIYNVTQGTITLKDGNSTILSRSLDECNPEYEYSILGYTYSIGLDEIDLSAIPQNRVLTFTFTGGNVTFVEKRIRINDFIFLVNTPERISTFMDIWLVDDEPDDASDEVIGFAPTESLNPMSVWIDAGAGYFNIYVNGTKVENLGELLSDEDETPTELEFHGFAHHEYAEFYLSLADLGINASGAYNIRVTHYPGDLDVNNPEDAYFYPVETELLNEDIVVDLGEAPDNTVVEPEINVPAIDKPSGEALIIDLPDDATGTVTLTVDNQNYTFDVVDGQAKVVLPNLDNGKYNYTVTYSGDAKYSKVSKTSSMTVLKEAAKVDVPAIENPKDDDVVTVDLPADATGTVTLTVDGKDYVFPVENGKANVKIPALANGGHDYTITYSGDIKYNKTVQTGSLTVQKPADTTPAPTADVVKLTLKTVKVKKSAKKLTLQATLKINGKAKKGLKVTFKFNGKTYKAKTNAKGVAKVTVKKAVLKKLKVSKKVKYQATYGKTTVKKSVKVKK